MARPPMPFEPIPSTLLTPPGAALRTLLLAWDYAEMVQRDPWDFAVESALLRRLGATPADLRWLIEQGYTHHAEERTTPVEKRRVFGPLDPAAITDSSCFVLTQGGAAAIFPLFREDTSPRRELPFYQPARGELWVCGLLVKRLRQPAPDQRAVFSAFQDQHWHFRIANPLSPHSFRDDLKIRLNHAMYRLNQNQVNR